MSLSSKVSLPHAIDCVAVCGANRLQRGKGSGCRASNYVGMRDEGLGSEGVCLGFWGPGVRASDLGRVWVVRLKVFSRGVRGVRFYTVDYAGFVPLDSEVLRDQICTT